jgi:sodium transport system permease protein
MILSIPNITGGAGNMGAGNISFTVGQMLQLVAIMVVLVYFYVGVIGLIATLSPNTRAASSTISPIYIVIIILGMMTMFRTGGTNSIGSYFIPVYGSALAISDLCNLELTSVNFLASVLGTLACGIILTFVVAKAFNSEKLMFNA